MSKKYPFPKIYTCKEWGAFEVGESFPTCHPKKSILHHMATQNFPLVTDPHKAVQAAFELARECQEMHVKSNGWSDTGQQLTVSRNGIILEGRHGSLAALLKGYGVVGAQCENFNSSSVGTEHEGNYMTEKMPTVQWNAAVKLQAALLDAYGLTTTDLEGHRDRCSTACPGNAFYAELEAFRAAVHSELTKWRAKNK